MGQFEELSKEANLAYDIIRRSSSVVCVWKNEEGWPVESVTENVQRIFGHNAEDFISGRVNYVSCIHSEDLDRVVVEVTTASNSGESEFRHVPYRIIDKEGNEKVVSDWTLIDRDEKGNITHYKGILEDITELHKAEQALEELNQSLEKRVEERTCELEEAIMELESFSYSVSHDLKAPVNRIIGFSRNLLEMMGEIDKEQMMHYLERIKLSAEDVSQLIDNLLKLSRLGSSDLVLEEMDVSPVANDVLSTLCDDQQGPCVKYRVHPSIRLVGDYKLLSILMGNLLSNAWKFSIREKNPFIEVGSEKLNGQQIVFVRDNGCGFDMKYHDELFRPFRKVHQGKSFPGSGLGMAIAVRIVNRHGGRIWADSAPGKGSTFYFRL